MSLIEEQIEYCQYRRKQIAELADWYEGFDMTGVSVSLADKIAGSPKIGDKIARNPANHADRWLVPADYFAVNFESCDVTQIRAQGQAVAWPDQWHSEYVAVMGATKITFYVPGKLSREEVKAKFDAPQPAQGMVMGFIKPDTDTHVYFYEQDHYYLSNFSAFRLLWKGIRFATSEQAYHWERFSYTRHKDAIIDAHSAHEAFRYAQDNKQHQRAGWDEIKVGIMRDILRAKVRQHEYVRRKLLQTGNRILVEDSWRDTFWGWGPNRDGLNMLGKLWMEVRAELLATAQKGEQPS